MITFESQAEFEAEVLKIIKEGLAVSVYVRGSGGDTSVEVTLLLNGVVISSDKDYS